MHVRKFEADSLDEALQQIKKELGPDAIILKTVTNKGLKGAFKKKKIEITAAVTEKDYVRKARVDQAMPSNVKEQFYNSPPSLISNMIDNYSTNRSSSSNAYGAMGVNRKVQTVSKGSSQIQLDKGGDFDLDSFLNEKHEEAPTVNSMDSFFEDEVVEERPAKREVKAQAPTQPSRADIGTNHEIDVMAKRLEVLEKKYSQVLRQIEQYDDQLPIGLYQLKNTLRSLDIDDAFTQRVIRKASFELTREQLADEDSVFEFALKEMMESIHTAIPLFVEKEKKPTITLLISEVSCGQSSLSRKMIKQCQNARIISYVPNENVPNGFSFIDKMLDIDHVVTNNFTGLMSEVRKSYEQGKTTILDMKLRVEDRHELKKFTDTLKRNFDYVEIILSLSAINSEAYNRKILSSYQQMADKMAINYLDVCMGFGNIFNLSNAYAEIPLVAFGTGETLPTDFELATPERLMAGIFKFN